MIIVRGVLRGIATEENLSPILLESVVKSIEHLRCDKITRDEHISSGKWLGLQNLESVFDYFLCRWKSGERGFCEKLEGRKIESVNGGRVL